MENFCKGLVFGMIAGTCVGAIIVARNKKLSKKLNQGLDITEEKIKETKEALEEKLNMGECCEGSCDENIANNNFSKKNKNC